MTPATSSRRLAAFAERDRFLDLARFSATRCAPLMNLRCASSALPYSRVAGGGAIGLGHQRDPHVVADRAGVDAEPCGKLPDRHRAVVHRSGSIPPVVYEGLQIPYWSPFSRGPIVRLV
jgi:hypothetical protein